MNLEELQTEITTTKECLDFVIENHKFSQTREERKHYNIEYSMLINHYIQKQNEYCRTMRYLKND